MPPFSLDWKEPTQDAFLDRYWQRQPLLWHQALPGYENPVDPSTLAQLACEDEIDARLIVHHPGQQPAWETHHGPFELSDFHELPSQGWTLLVQSVDAWMPEVAELTEAFDFLPSWRLDDIMISHATEGGGVGPHIDQYDVFLLQAAGHRRWRYGTRSGSSQAYRPDLDLRILEAFEPTHEAVLKPGDLLYLPPGVAHEGVALDNDCLTFSIGFRAPSVADLASRFADVVAEHAERLGDEVPRYTDAGIGRSRDPHAIAPKALAQMTTLLRNALDDQSLMGRAIGGLMTEPRLSPEPADPMIEPAALRSRMVSGDSLIRTLGSRWAHLGVDEQNALLCVNGDCWQIEFGLAVALCANRSISLHGVEAWQNEPVLWSLLSELHDLGCLNWYEPK